MKKIFADRDCANYHIFVACSDSFLLKDSFAAKLSPLVKFHLLLSLNTASIFADPKKVKLLNLVSSMQILKIKECTLLYDYN